MLRSPPAALNLAIFHPNILHIIESVDFISRDTPIYVIHKKNPKSSVQLQFQDAYVIVIAQGQGFMAVNQPESEDEA